MSEYEQDLEAWKAKHGLTDLQDGNPDELRMATEDQASNKQSWCLGCDKKMPIKVMKIITRARDPYLQIDEGETDYIKPSLRVRMCPACFEEKYKNV